MPHSLKFIQNAVQSRLARLVDANPHVYVYENVAHLRVEPRFLKEIYKKLGAIAAILDRLGVGRLVVSDGVKEWLNADTETILLAAKALAPDPAECQSVFSTEGVLLDQRCPYTCDRPQLRGVPSEVVELILKWGYSPLIEIEVSGGLQYFQGWVIWRDGCLAIALSLFEGMGNSCQCQKFQIP